jgi:signal transduction histidine kinase/ActR/RegA family two-component response regulator
VDESGTLRIEAQRGFAKSFLAFYSSVREGIGCCGTALQRGERVVVEDVRVSPIFKGTQALEVMLEAGALAVQSTPLFSRSGQLVGMFSTHYRQPRRPSERDLRLLDLLSRQAADLIERTRAEARLREAQKLESIGLLAGGVAHDFNNILVGVLGNASLAADMLPPRSPVRPLLTEIENAAERAADLTRQMLAYAGKGRFLVEPVDLSSVARETVKLVQPSISKKISLQLNLDGSLPAIRADRSQVQQVVMNLVLNAAEAIGDQAGLITIRTGSEQVRDRLARNDLGGAEMIPGTYVRLEVRDTGCGMDDQNKARIFDPFFSTKFTGRGLGLAAVAGVVRGHNGAVRVTSAPGAGTTLVVMLPASDENAADELDGVGSAAGEPARGLGRILIVDDEQVVLRTAKLALEKRGYEVVLAESGASAVEVFKQSGGRFDLVLLDLSMPAMSGQETLARLREHNSEIPVIVSSGYSETEAARQFVGQTISGFLQKPFTAAQLFEKVASTLGSKRLSRAFEAPSFAAVRPQ